MTDTDSVLSLGKKDRLGVPSEDADAGGAPGVFPDDDFDDGGMPHAGAGVGAGGDSHGGAGKGDAVEVSAPAVVKCRHRFSHEEPPQATGADRVTQSTMALFAVKRANETKLSDAREAEAVRIRDEYLTEVARRQEDSEDGRGHRVSLAGFSDASNMGTPWEATAGGGAGFKNAGASSKQLQINALVANPLLHGLEPVLMAGMPAHDHDLQLRTLEAVVRRLPAAMRPHQQAAINREYKAELAVYVDSLLYRGNDQQPCPLCLFFDIIRNLVASHNSTTPDASAALPQRRRPPDEVASDDDGLGDTVAPSAKRRRGQAHVERVYLGAARWTPERRSSQEAIAELVALTAALIQDMDIGTDVSLASAVTLFNSKLLPALMQDQSGVWAALAARHPSGGMEALALNVDTVRTHLVKHMRWIPTAFAHLIDTTERDVDGLSLFGSLMENKATGETSIDPNVVRAVQASRNQLRALYTQAETVFDKRLTLDDCIFSRVMRAAPTITDEADGGAGAGASAGGGAGGGVGVGSGPTAGGGSAHATQGKRRRAAGRGKAS